ncbi:hypothetical protein E2C01_076827 [Portunus trituberculatus]|uniref:Uncharacterized protein n=1 Tax=Portunus trituberculatus TaxID=210409 RepID=A0A5B7ICS3_PORTR|nr:hypothetical protein [Portunus trituberculatus]
MKECDYRLGAFRSLRSDKQSDNDMLLVGQARCRGYQGRQVRGKTKGLTVLPADLTSHTLLVDTAEHPPAGLGWRFELLCLVGGRRGRGSSEGDSRKREEMMKDMRGRDLRLRLEVDEEDSRQEIWNGSHGYES